MSTNTKLYYLISEADNGEVDNVPAQELVVFCMKDFKHCPVMTMCMLEGELRPIYYVDFGKCSFEGNIFNFVSDGFDSFQIVFSGMSENGLPTGIECVQGITSAFYRWDISPDAEVMADKIDTIEERIDDLEDKVDAICEKLNINLHH